jgi:hypothetical protein
LGNGGAYDPLYLQSAYNAPSSTKGSGQTVAVVDAYDDPHAEADLDYYRSHFGLSACTTANGCFKKVDQNGGLAYPSPDQGWAGEISLDLDMVSALCPNCHILLVEANDTYTSDLGAAVNEATTLGANAVSNSYGGDEYRGENADSANYYNHPGRAITVSSGDSGYGVQFPAASQDVTSVGGTSLHQYSNTGTRGNGSEAAWSGAGSGCSAYAPKPSWQSDTGCPNRTVADTSADADPNTGVWTYDTYGLSGFEIFGGTSAAAPMIASLYALAQNPTSSGQLASYPYRAPAGALHDVTSGSNGSCSPSYLCTAGTGYDGPTGVGTPDSTPGFSAPVVPPPPAPYHALTPARITDTRPDSGFPNAGATLPPGTTLNVGVTGAGGVPPAGVTAAVLNVTATNPTQQSYLTVWPAGAVQPTASNLNFGPGQTVANLVEVGLGSNGQVSLFNLSGSVDIVVDVEGYVGPSATAGTGLYKPLTPARITDTRPTSGFLNAGETLGPGDIRDVQVTGAGGVPSTGVAAVVLNVTATDPTEQSFLTVWPAGSAQPTASNVNFAPNQTVPNRVQVPVGTNGEVSVFNPTGSVDVVVDVAGYFTDASIPSATGARFTPTTPARITDTRSGSVYPNGDATLAPGGSIRVKVMGAGGVPATGVSGAILNVTVTNPTQPSYLTVWPTDATQPLSSDLNWVARQTVPNLVVAKLGSDGAVNVYNGAGSVDVVVDVSGWYA